MMWAPFLTCVVVVVSGNAETGSAEEQLVRGSSDVGGEIHGGCQLPRKIRQPFRDCWLKCQFRPADSWQIEGVCEYGLLPLSPVAGYTCHPFPGRQFRNGTLCLAAKTGIHSSVCNHRAVASLRLARVVRQSSQPCRGRSRAFAGRVKPLAIKSI